MAERIRASVENTSFSADGKRVASTVSIGVSSFARRTATGEEIVAEADKYLYESKRQGKNRVSHP